MHNKEKEKDEILVNGLIAGDESCFDSLFIRYSGAIYNVGRLYRFNQHDAEEIVQDVFAKVWENRTQLKSELSFKAYLYAIAKNMILKTIRRRTIDFAFKRYFISHTSFIENSTENVVSFNELRKVSDEIINQLPPQRKKVFLMNRLEGLKSEEIAIRTGLSKRTVERHIYDAQKFIRGKMTFVKISTLLFLAIIL